MPPIGSLWVTRSRNVALGHEADDVIVVMRAADEDDPRVRVAFVDDMSAPGYICLNRRGLVFYPDVWWQLDEQGLTRYFDRLVTDES